MTAKEQSIIGKATIEKLGDMTAGKLTIMSDCELDTLAILDVSNLIRSRPNPKQCGTLDRWECWIERKDLARFNP